MTQASGPPTDEWEGLQQTIAVALAGDPVRRRPADPWYAARMAEWLSEGLVPEEWAARHAHELACWSGGGYRYADPTLDAWVRRLAAVLWIPGATAVCQRHFLTEAEIAPISEREWQRF